MDSIAEAKTGMGSIAVNRLLVGIDVGGTFTDFVVYDAGVGVCDSFKLLSTPGDPSQSVLQGLEKIQSEHPGCEIWVVHGTTVATNALLERKGAPTALVTTAGFRDLLQIGRQNRPALYDLFVKPTSPLVERSLCFEAEERVDQHGEALLALDPVHAANLAERVAKSGAQSVAVCLLFSFVNPHHERLIAAELRKRGLSVSLSSEILPEFREYERASTTAVNAYVTPRLDDYLGRLDQAVKDKGTARNVRIMQSNGGTMRLERARRHGVQCILSGPAGGVVGAQFAAHLAAEARGDRDPLRLITFDMGGTSTDVALIDGEPRVTTESLVGGFPIRIPVIDIHTFVAGGGSIARADQGGALRVGPESAGADPGPACYGRARGKTFATVTDANLVLGRILAQEFLGGAMPLDVEKAKAAIAGVGKSLGMDTEQAALGIVEVVNAHMERALRIISVERGYDPAAFTLLSFGGAGGLHAVDLARQMGIQRVLAPPLASTLSALGMLAADVVRDASLTVMRPGDTPLEELSRLLEPLVDQATGELVEDGVAPEQIIHLPQADLRYKGQSYELTVPLSSALLEHFHQAHHRAYGYHRHDAEIEIVNLRLRAIAKTSKPRIRQSKATNQTIKSLAATTHLVRFTSGSASTPVFRWSDLAPGAELQGPALVVRPDTTLLLSDRDRAGVDVYGNVIVEVAPHQGRV
jgi:N-methylhydantoinase A